MRAMHGYFDERTNPGYLEHGSEALNFQATGIAMVLLEGFDLELPIIFTVEKKREDYAEDFRGFIFGPRRISTIQIYLFHFVLY